MNWLKQQKNRLKKYWKQAFIFASFALLFFVPRYFAHLQYDALEDELLAIGNNIDNSLLAQFLAPDVTHPPFWYILMHLPTKILGLDHGIFYYRLIQVLIMFFMIIFSIAFFYKKLPHRFLFVFFSLLLSNAYLVHLTSQHRMYAMVFGISIFYSFYWYDLIKSGKDDSFKHFILLGLIAVAGFFTSYSAIWIIPVWPLAYLLNKRNLDAIKRLFVFLLTFLVSISWFIPIFIRNTRESIALNQWAAEFNLLNVSQVIGSYFGILPILEDLNKVNILLAPFLLLFFILFYYKITHYKKSNYLKSVLFSTVLSLCLFFLTVYLTGNSLLYPRPSITIVIAFYVIVAASAVNNSFSKLIISLLIIFQLSQFPIYFFPDSHFAVEYDWFNYRTNPISYFQAHPFENNSCLFSIPNWNFKLAKYFLGKSVRVVYAEEAKNEIKNCPVLYVLDQTSVDRERINEQYNSIFGEIPPLFLVDSFENQSLYVLDYK